MTVLDETVIEEKPKTGILKIPLDPIHGGLRIAVFGSFVGAGIAGFIAGIYLIPNLAILAFVIAGASAAGTSMSVENLLKDRWQSGRELVADAERIALTKNSKIESVIDPTQQVNVLLWRFEVKKEGPRAKKGWQVLGMGFEQDDNYVVVYTAASVDDFENMPLSNRFTKLEKEKKDKKKNLSSASTMRRAGEQKRLYEGEVVRQLVGGDMLFEQFIETIEFMQTQYPHWMIRD